MCGVVCGELLMMPMSQPQLVSGPGCCLALSSSSSLQQLCLVSLPPLFFISRSAVCVGVLVIVSAVPQCCCIAGCRYLWTLTLAAAERLSELSRAQPQTAEEAE